MTTDAADRRQQRPELERLSAAEKQRVRDELARQYLTCGGCGERSFAVRSALYLGFLFASEPLDAWMVALTCVNDSCPAPHTGIRLAEAAFRNGKGA